MQVGEVEAEGAGRQRDPELAGRQHQALPQVREARREERRLQPGRLPVPTGTPLDVLWPVWLRLLCSARPAVLMHGALEQMWLMSSAQAGFLAIRRSQLVTIWVIALISTGGICWCVAEPA